MICLDCCNKIPQTDALHKQQKFSSHHSGGWMSKMWVPAWSEGPSSGSQISHFILSALMT